jgi:hypothetical protein
MTVQVANTYSGIDGMGDLLGLAGQWLSQDCTDTPTCGGADLDNDADVTVTDFAVLVHNWLLDEDLQLHLKFDETDGTTAVDSSLYDRHGTLTNGPVWSSGHSGGALSFDGIDDYVQVSGYYGITGTASRTCCAWVRPSAVSCEILSWGADPTGAKWTVRINEDGALRAQVNGGYIYGTTVLTDGQWHHVALTLSDDGSPNISEALLYVDGVPDAVAVASPYAVNTGNTNEVHVGVYYGLLRYFNGLIDDVRIYDRALSAQEIQDIAAP